MSTAGASQERNPPGTAKADPTPAAAQKSTTSFGDPVNVPLPHSPPPHDQDALGQGQIDTPNLASPLETRGDREQSISASEIVDDSGPNVELDEAELEWSRRYDFLFDAGYCLRPRYKPGWTPPKLENYLARLDHEDAIGLNRDHVIDATRRKDRQVVMLKIIPTDTAELDISSFLWSEDLRKILRNHSVPLLDVLHDPSDPKHAIIVLPLLRRIDSPPPASVREVVEFVEQTLEGLAFMHENHVAHRDNAWGNIMMDGRKLFPKGWHPQRWRFQSSGTATLSNQTPSRTASGGVRYYFIDFGISSRDQDSVTGVDCQEPAPELSQTVPYDPYALDVYVLGMAYKHFILESFGRTEFLKPLVEYMTPLDPKDRPTATAALERFHDMSGKLKWSDLTVRLTPKVPESTMTRRLKDSLYQFLELWWSVKPRWGTKPQPFS